MHSSVSYYDEGSGEDPEAKNVCPVCKDIKTKGAENRCARNFDVEAVFVVDQSEIFNFVHDESFKPVMKYRKLSELVCRMLRRSRFTHFLKPLRTVRYGIVVEK